MGGAGAGAGSKLAGAPAARLKLAARLKRAARLKLAGALPATASASATKRGRGDESWGRAEVGEIESGDRDLKAEPSQCKRPGAPEGGCSSGGSRRVGTLDRGARRLTSAATATIRLSIERRDGRTGSLGGCGAVSSMYSSLYAPTKSASPGSHILARTSSPSAVPRCVPRAEPRSVTWTASAPQSMRQ